jgi:hypothetical protein
LEGGADVVMESPVIGTKLEKKLASHLARQVGALSA